MVDVHVLLLRWLDSKKILFFCYLHVWLSYFQEKKEFCHFFQRLVYIFSFTETCWLVAMVTRIVYASFSLRKNNFTWTRCQYWHFRGMLWPHLFPLYASHIFKASLLRYGVLEIIWEISFWPGADIYLRAIFISYHITREHTRNCFLMTWPDYNSLHHWKTYEDQLHWKLIVKDIYIFFLQGKTQSVSENAISPPCTAQFCTIYTVEQSLGVILFYLPLQKG